MRPKDAALGQRLDEVLVHYDRHVRPLLGVRAKAHRESFVEQVIESVRRVKFITFIEQMKLSDLRGDPRSHLFDPLKAAVLRKRAGDLDDAFWLVFLSVHFGKNRRAEWELTRNVYGCLSGKHSWNWARVSSDPRGFRRWLRHHQAPLKPDGVVRFGNHRKYQSLDATSPTGTGAAVESYVRWVHPPRSHSGLMADVARVTGGGPRENFRALYDSMDAVISFGRTAKFDYLTMVGKLGLAPIEADSTYMGGATGPFTGARLLFGGAKNAAFRRRDLDAWVSELEAALSVGPQGMQVMEDALCNWQKSPTRFVPFRG